MRIMKIKIIELINKNKDGVIIKDLIKHGFKLSTIRSTISEFEKEGLIVSRKIGTTKLYFLVKNDRAETLISLIKRADYFGIPLKLLFNYKNLFFKYYDTPSVSKRDVENVLKITNASELIKKLTKHNLLRIIKRKPLIFCFHQNDVIELFLTYFEKPVSKRVRYDYNDFNASFMTPADINYLKDIKSGYSKAIGFYSSKKDAFDRFLGYFIYNTCGIEGNKISLRDTPQILKEGRIPINVEEKDYVDYINTKDVVYKILINNEFKRDINHELILSINRKLLDRIHVKAGEYRTQGFDLRPFGAGFESSSGKYVKEDVGVLIKLYYSLKKNNVHPLIIATIFHHKFEKIHPFFEGNGRTGRILLNYILMRSGFPPLVVEKRRKRRYYSSLSIADRKAGDLKTIDSDAYLPLFKYFFNQLDKTYHTSLKI